MVGPRSHGEGFIQSTPNRAWFRSLSVSDEARLMNIFAGEADVGGSRWANIVLLGNDVCTDGPACYFAAILRRIVFIR
jgi:hypothetical protein